MAAYPELEELNAICDSDPCRELWVESQWRSWKYALRSLGKRECVATLFEAAGSLADLPLQCEPAKGSDDLPLEIHDRIRIRLYTALTSWLRSDDADTRNLIADALGELDDAVAKEHAKFAFRVVCSRQPVHMLAFLAKAVIAKSSFEVHLRHALVEATSISPAIVQRFRHALLRSRTNGSS